MTTIVHPSSSSSPAGSAAKKPSTPGQPWSHLETTALIDAYESKWYSLKRGQLKAQQWEEVAAAVSARCSASPSSSAPHQPPPKSGTQCRHKIEKLRKRYRSEKARPLPSLWPYFDRMERMERGPLPVSVKPPAAADSDVSGDDDDDDDDDDNEDGDGYSKRGDGYSKRGDGVGILMEVAREVRRVGEGMVRVEKRRMEMMREVERDRMEMETKRADMVVEAQREILGSIAAAFAAVKKKAKKADKL